MRPGVQHIAASEESGRQTPRMPRATIGCPAPVIQHLAAWLFVSLGLLITPMYAVGQNTVPVANPDSVLTRFSSSDSLGVEDLYLRARAYEEKKEYGRAADDFERLLQIEPGHIEAALGLRRVRPPRPALSEKDFELLRLAVESNPKSPSLRFRYGDALYRSGQLDAAIEQFQLYLADAQASPDALTTILLAIAASGQHHELGEQISLEYSRIYPENDDLFTRLGYFRLWQRKLDAAKSAFQIADSLSSGNSLAKQGLADVDSLSRIIATSKTRMTTLLDQVTRSKGARNDSLRLRLVESLLQEGRYFDADQHLAIIGRRSSVDESIRKRVETLLERLRSGGPVRPASSIDRLIVALRQNPGDLESRYALVESLLARKRYFEAYDVLNAVREEEGETKRWLDFFLAADTGLVETQGQSRLYGVDRLTSRLLVDPGNRIIRYALIDSLLEQHRYAEAGDLLQSTPDVTPDDQGHTARIIALAKGRVEFAAREIARADTLRASSKSLPPELARALPDYLLITGDLPRALRAFEELVQRGAEDPDLLADWVRFLRSTGNMDRAKDVADSLLVRFAEDIQIQKEYVLCHLPYGLDDFGQSLFDRLQSDSSQTDGRFFIEAADLLLAEGQNETADSIMSRAKALDQPLLAAGIDMLSERLQRDSLIIARESDRELLRNAQQYAQSGLLDASVDQYLAYFKSTGIRLRDEWRQLAWVFIADSLFDEALDILEGLNEAIDGSNPDDAKDFYDLKKDLARIRAATGDSRGAIDLIDELKAINPRDFETRFLESQIQRESGEYEQALSAYEDARALASGSSWLDEGWQSLNADYKYALLESGEWNGYDYSGIVVPVAETVHAGGGGTFYDRVSEGLRAEVTLPIGAVLTAGFVSHFISGTRRQVPDAEEVRGRTNQIFGGIYLDLTPPVRSEKAPYSNRLFVEAGLLDYEGQRSVGYFDARYWRQVPGAYIAEAGIRSSEGAIDLWSPAGGEFNLRLTQVNLRAEGVPFSPDSLLRIAGRLAIHAVSDNLGILSSGSDQNIGTEVQLEAGYNVLPHTYFGLVYHALDFGSRTDLYFSPEHYESTEIFLEYEKEVPTSWYIRLRGALGAVSRSAGALSKRVELDLIRRLTDTLSLTISSTLGETSRSLGGGDTSLYSRYNMFNLSGRVYWTL